MTDLLEAGLERLFRTDSINLEYLIPALRRYIEEIELFNPAYGLVGAKDRSELIVKHILDSLAPLPALRSLLGPGILETTESMIADAGSGAGLPGIPLALAWPEARFTLIERMERRVVFLENATVALGLRNTTIECVEVEKAAPFRFNIVVFRAFRPLDAAMLATLRRLLKPGGVLAAYKGRRERIDAEMAAIAEKTVGWEALPVAVPFLDEERHLVVIRF